MNGRYQGLPSNPYSFDSHVSYTYTDGPATHTHSKACNTTADATLLTDPTTTSTNDKVNAHLPLTEDLEYTL